MNNQREAQVEINQIWERPFTHAFKLNSLVAKMASIKVRFGWLIIIAALLRIIPFAVSAPSSLVELKKSLLILAYVLLFLALSRNLRLWSMRLLTLGAVLNFVAIVANGGLMPVSPEAGLQAGIIAIDQYGLGEPLPGGGSILLLVNQTNLWFLSDIIPISFVRGVFSIGDIIIAIGLLIFFVEAARRGNTDSRRKELPNSFAADVSP